MLIIRVNMTDQTYKVEDVPKAYKYLAGRAMTSTLVADEVPPLCHPLGPNNKLVFSPGIVTGTPAPTSARVSVGAKSPLTGGIKEANAGTSWGADLADMQIKALVLEGQPKEKGKYCGLHIAWDKGAGKPKSRVLRCHASTLVSLYRGIPESLQEIWRPHLHQRRRHGRRVRLWQLWHGLQRQGQARQPLCRARRPGSGDGQQGCEVHHPGPQRCPRRVKSWTRPSSTKGARR